MAMFFLNRNCCLSTTHVLTGLTIFTTRLFVAPAIIYTSATFPLQINYLEHFHTYTCTCTCTHTSACLYINQHIHRHPHPIKNGAILPSTIQVAFSSAASDVVQCNSYFRPSEWRHVMYPGFSTRIILIEKLSRSCLDCRLINTIYHFDSLTSLRPTATTTASYCSTQRRSFPSSHVCKLYLAEI
jgi:hypothetical protein